MYAHAHFVALLKSTKVTKSGSPVPRVGCTAFVKYLQYNQKQRGLLWLFLSMLGIGD